MTYMEFKEKKQKEVNELPMYFAFSDKQFNELMVKLGYDDENVFLKDIMTIGGGSIILKKDKELIMNTFDRIYKELTENFINDEFLESAFEYELGNHEYCITYDISETLDTLDISYDEYKMSERIQRISKKAIKKYMNKMRKMGW